MKTIKQSLILVAVLFTASSCTTQKHEPLYQPYTGYTDFQYALLGQGSLLLIKNEGYWYTGSWLDGMVLESLPPQLKVKIGDEVLTVSITKIVSPLAVAKANNSAEVLVDGTWQPVKTRLTGFQFEIDQNGQWLPVTQLRFRIQ
jgi:hypothetical protein